MRRAFVWTPVALAVAAAAWWATREVGAPLRSRGAPGAPGAAAHGLASASAPVLGGDVRLPAAAGAPADEVPGVVVAVRVVDAATRAPVAGADVCWVDASTHVRLAALPAAERARCEYDPDPDRLARELGRHVRSDSQGVVHVPVPHGAELTVHAHDAGRSGVAKVEVADDATAAATAAADDASDRAPVELELEVDRAVTVRVLDATGHPAPNVRVHLGRDGPAAERCLASSPHPTWRTGEVTFSRLQRSCERTASGERAPEEWYAEVFHLAGIEDLRVAFAALAPPREPVVLTLPPTGEIVVHVLPAGRPLESLSAYLYANDVPSDPFTCERGTTEYGDGDRVRFPYVPLGRRFALMTRVGDAEVRQETNGPVRAGDVVHVPCELRDVVAVAGRVLAPGGEPIAARDVGVDYRSTWTEGRRTFTTDAAGRFVWHAGLHDASSELRTMELSLRTERPLEEWRAVVAPRRLTPGVNELGDVRLELPPLVVAGRFVANGTPRGDVQFTVERWCVDETADDGVWRTLAGVHAYQHDGRFVVRGARAPGRHRLTFDTGAHVARQPVEFAVGADDLVIPIEWGTTVTFELRLPDDVVQNSLCFDLHVAGEAEPLRPLTREGWETRVPSHALRPGTYHVRAYVRGIAEPVAISPPVVIPGEAPARASDGGRGAERIAERIVEIDLRNMTTLGVALQPPEVDEPVVVLIDQPAAAYQQWGHRADGAPFRVPVPPRPVDVRVLAYGRRPIELRGVRDEVVVAPGERLPTFPIDVRGVPRLPGGVRVVVKAFPADAGSPRFVEASLPGSRLLSELTGAPSVELVLTADAVSTVIAADVDRIVAATLELASGPWLLRRVTPAVLPAGAAPVTLRLDADEIRALLRENGNENRNENRSANGK